MGWKTLKLAYNIEHFVTVRDGKINIGSGYIDDLIQIDISTGAFVKFESRLAEKYPNLKAASPKEILRLINEPDTFAKAVRVFTYDDNGIHERFCEETGWPNVTNEGEMMHDNKFSTDKSKVVAWAKEEMLAGIRLEEREIKSLTDSLAKSQDALQRYKAKLQALNLTYPQD